MSVRGRFGLAGDRAIQPDLGVGPVAVGGRPRDSQRVCRLLDRKPGEVAQLDQLRLDGILPGQLIQRFVQKKDLVRRLGAAGHRFIQVDPLAAASVFEAVLAACVFDKNPPHGFRRRGEEVAAAIPVLRPVHVHQPRISLMDQRRGFERLAGLLLGQLRRRQFAQLIVDQRQQLLRGACIAVFDGGQNLGDGRHDPRL
jgi:hypothetical protein